MAGVENVSLAVSGFCGRGSADNVSRDGAGFQLQERFMTAGAAMALVWSHTRGLDG